MSIDLTGQVAADALPPNHLPGGTGMLDFIRGATTAPGGKSILMLPSTAMQGKKSGRLTPDPLERRASLMRIAFLGLGAIGTPMAAHIAKRHQLTVWNRTGSRATAFAAAHPCAVAATPREAAAGAEVVITCLPTSTDVESLLDGPDGLLAGLGKGALFLDCTSGDPDTTRRIGERLASPGIDFADAPVSGGTNGAEAGTLTVMVGGSDEIFQRARPVLECFDGGWSTWARSEPATP